MTFVAKNRAHQARSTDSSIASSSNATTNKDAAEHIAVSCELTSTHDHYQDTTTSTDIDQVYNCKHRHRQDSCCCCCIYLDHHEATHNPNQTGAFLIDQTET